MSSQSRLGRDLTLRLIQPKPVSHVNAFTIKAPKTDQLHHSHKIYICHFHEKFCPYSAIQKYIGHFPHSPAVGAQSLFTFRDGSPLTRHSCLKHLHRFIHKAGYLLQDFTLTAFELVLLRQQPTLACQRTRSNCLVDGIAKPTADTFALATQPKWQLRHLLPHR